MKTKNNFIAIACAIAMACTLSNTNVYAIDSEGVNVEGEVPVVVAEPAAEETTEVASINGTNYTSLKDAINAANDGDKISLLKDVDLQQNNGADMYGSAIEINKKVSIDGNNHNILVGTTYAGENRLYGFMVTDNGVLNLSNVTIKEKEGSQNNINAIGVLGGIVNLNNGAVIDGFNSCHSGAAIDVGNNGKTGTVNMTGSKILNCRSPRGGAIYISKGSITTNGATFENCKAYNSTPEVEIGSGTDQPGCGGAIAVYSDNEEKIILNLENTTFTNCKADVWGGSLTLGFDKDETTIKDCTFDNNNALVGGAIYIPNGALTVSNTTFKENKATQDGGAIYIGGTETYKFPSVTLSDECVITGNSAEQHGSGVALKHKDSRLTIDGKVTIFNNAKIGENDNNLEVIAADGEEGDPELMINIKRVDDMKIGITGYKKDDVKFCSNKLNGEFAKEKEIDFEDDSEKVEIKDKLINDLNKDVYVEYVPTQYDNGKYYWRKDVTVKFDLNRGTSSNKIEEQVVQAGIGKSKKPENVPTRQGYKFVGWKTAPENGNPFNFGEVVNEDTTVYATWERDSKQELPKYKVTFDLKNGSGEIKEQTVVEDEYAKKPNEVPTKEGYTFVGWMLDGNEFNFDTTKITKDITLKATYKKNETVKKTYTVTFNTDGGTGKFDSQTVVEDEYAKKPNEVPTKDGYTFDKWVDQDGKEFNFDTTKITKDITLKATYTENKKYTVTFNTDGGKGDFKPQTVEEGNKASKPSTEPTKDGYTFDKWVDQDGNEFNFDTTITKDITLTATYTENEKYTVTFNTDGGKGKFDSQTVEEGNKASKPSTEPTKDGYTFDKWVDQDGNEFNFDTTITKDITLKATYTENKKYTVTFNTDGGKGKFDSQTVEEGNKASKPSAVPTKDGYTFDKWVDEEGNEFNFDTTKITKNITLKATYKKNETAKKTYTVTFNTDGGKGKFDSQTVEEGNKVSKPSTEPTKDGYKFVGWMLDGKAYDFNTEVKNSIELVAKYEKEVKEAPKKETPKDNTPSKNGTNVAEKAQVKETVLPSTGDQGLNGYIALFVVSMIVIAGCVVLKEKMN